MRPLFRRESCIQQSDYFVLIFNSMFLSQNEVMIVKCFNFNNLEYVGTISSINLLC